MSRGCGEKTYDSAYVEGPDEGAGGMLRRWAWVLGNGYRDIITLKIPARIVVICNPAATIAAREFINTLDPVFHKIPFLEPSYDVRAAYRRIAQKTKTVGVADHVGKDNYSAYSFASEVVRMGPSRKVPPQLASELAQIIWDSGPIPMLFTHDRMPVFNNPAQLEEAVDLAANCLEDLIPIDPDAMEWVPTWEMEGWSQYATTPDDGYDHVLVPILRVLGTIEKDWSDVKDDKRYQLARSFFSNIRMVEQPFGLSWMGKVTYTADQEGNYSDQAKRSMHIYGGSIINWLDLDEEQEQM